MRRSQALFPDREGPSVECFGLILLSLFSIEPRQIVQRVGNIGMLLSIGLLVNGQSLLIQGFGLLVLALLRIEQRQVVQRAGLLGTIWSQDLLAHAQGALIQRLCLWILSALAQIVGGFAQHLHPLLVPDLVRDGARTEEHMRQQAFALPPGFVADFRKQGSKEPDHAPLPERSLWLTHPLSNDRLHEPVDGEGLLLHMTTEQRIAIEGPDRLM